VRHHSARQPRPGVGPTPEQLWAAIAGGRGPAVVARELAAGVGERGSTVVRSVSSGFLADDDWSDEHDPTSATGHQVVMGMLPDWPAHGSADRSASPSDCIGLVVLAPAQLVRDDPHFARLIAAATTAAGAHCLTLAVHVVGEAGLGSAPPLAGDPRYAGALLVNVTANRATGLCARRPRAPLVSLGKSAPWLPCVNPDNAGGAAAAVGHLVAQGRRDVAMVSGPAWNPCSAERTSGYRQAMAAFGLRPLVAGADFTPQGAAKATARLLHDRPALDALFVASDLMAVGALAALRAGGRRAPDDVAVVGFDNSLPSVLSTPPLSSVHQPVEEIVAAAVEAILESGGKHPQEQRLPTKLVVRASSSA